MAFPSGARILAGNGAFRFRIVNRFGEEIGKARKKDDAKRIAGAWHPTVWDFVRQCMVFFPDRQVREPLSQHPI